LSGGPRTRGLIARSGLAGTLLLTACSGGGLVGPASPACPTEAPTATEAPGILAGVTAVTVETTLGAFTVTLNATSAPVAAANFVELAGCGFYDGITFHRVLTGYVIQAGDPNTKENRGDFEGLGSGGPGYGFPIELPADDQQYDAYTVAMANDQVRNGSQLFVCLTDIDDRLPTRTYSIIGTVTEGQDVVDAIGAVEVNHPALGVPVDPVVINGMEVAEAESTPS
jgi:cyclophilin family peptidyl-prolyl cis-trans isomerase